MNHFEKCRSCESPIVWAVTEKGKRIPIDAEPVDNGNIILMEQPHREPLAVYVKPRVGVKRFVSHFATCKDSKKWRKK